VAVSDRRSSVSLRGAAVGYASDPERFLSAAPLTLIDDVDGGAGRPRVLSLA